VQEMAQDPPVSSRQRAAGEKRHGDAEKRRDGD
jgi:hypothetical protein